MLEAGLLAEGDAPTPEQYARNMRKLRDLIRYEQTQGLKLFLLSDTSVTLVQGQGHYKFGPTSPIVMAKPTRVIQAYLLDPTGTRRPLVPLSWDDYMRLSQVNQQGAINSYFVDKQATYLDVFFWLIPDAFSATCTAQLLFQLAATAPVNLTDTTCFPDEWRMYLVWGLADQIAGGQPESIMMRCKQNAEQYRAALEDWDVEDTMTSFQPDSRGLHQYNSFR
jgi:hypothetical protein